MKAISSTLLLLSVLTLSACGSDVKFASVEEAIQQSEGQNPTPTTPTPSYPSQPSDYTCNPNGTVYNSGIMGGGNAYYFGIYRAQDGQVSVNVAYGHAAQSIDLYLHSYAATTWSIGGNVAAVRSVRIIGYESAYFTGVNGNLVSVSTYVQNSMPYSGYYHYSQPYASANYRKIQHTYDACVTTFDAN